MTASEVRAGIAQLGAQYHNLLIPEFTFGGRRIDALVVDLHHRRCRGFEIKVSRADFLADGKWTEYSSFCSSLSIACPAGLIEPGEIEKPFGLLHVSPLASGRGYALRWAKRPQDFQGRRSLAWLWTYVKILETEIARLSWEGARAALAYRESQPKPKES